MSQNPPENLVEVASHDLLAVGFKVADSYGIFWHWTGRCGVELLDGKFVPCDMFDNGTMQYADASFDDFTEAARYSMNFFS